jgi:hypothetical protein
MRYTEHYRLASLEPNEPLNPLEDSRRFLTIDRNILGIMQVLGNGVITGWDVVQRSGLTVAVTPGRGNISFFAAETTEPRTVTGLAPDATNYIYAQAIEQTRFTRDVAFFADTLLFQGSQAILLARVVTVGGAVTEIDTSVRTDISFIETIKQLINQHRHRGGGDNPSKIDLGTEVSGQLPGFRVEGLDAAKVTSGRLAPARVPQLEHSSLLHSGVLSHAQLDSFVRNLSNPNVRLLGELSSINMMQLWLAQKHIWHDVDLEAHNLLLMIPGISPDEFTDYASTTAIVDKFYHTISGIPSLAGKLLATTFRTESDFRRAFLSVNTQIGSDGDGAFFKLTKPFSETIVENFDNVFEDDADFADWTLETVSSNDDSSFKSNKLVKADGAFSGKLTLDQSFRIQATKFFESAQDWSGYNELEASISTLSSAHGQIWFQILGGEKSNPTEVGAFKLLETNEVTSGFRKVKYDLLSVDRSKIIGIRIFADTSLGWDLAAFSVNVDSIKLNNNLFYKPSGLMRFRIETPQTTKWAGISWDGDTNGGTIQVRARSAPNFSVLDNSTAIPFTSYSSENGFNPNVVDNPAIEVEVAISADSTKTATPVLRSVSVSYITSSEDHGLTINTAEQFLRGSKFANTRVKDTDGDGDVVIDGRVDVGDVAYGLPRSLQQVDQFGTPIYGVTGSDLFLSPIQAIREEFALRQPALEGVTTAQRLPDRSYLVSDTMNDRILLFDREGELVSGLASNNVRNAEGLYPLTATYNQSEGVLYVAWSKNVSYSGVNLSQFTLKASGIVLPLSSSLDRVIKVEGVNTQLESGNVTAIALSNGHALELKTYLEAAGEQDSRLYLDVAAGAVSEGVDVTNANFATLVGPRGLRVFVGNVKFVKGLFRPIGVTLTSAGTWLVCNAKPLVTSESGTDPLTGTGRDEITSIVEFDPATGEAVFSDDSVDFSVATLGGACEYEERYVAVAGIVKDSENVSSDSATDAIGQGQQADAQNTDSADATTDKDVLSGFRGRVKIVEKSSGRVIFEQATSDGTYGADVQVDADGNLVIVEKAFDDKFGRGRVVKMDADGNVFFQYGLTELASPNDVRILSTGNIVVSS